VFVTSTDSWSTRRHEGVLTIFDFEIEGTELIAEGRVEPDGRFTFLRWRFNRR
jgi:hypothetical protein